MKFPVLAALGFIIVLTVGQIVDTEEELICNPSNPKDCYPKLFNPTKEWQNIREGQNIPAGLHVRLNIDTSQREAKLMDESSEQVQPPQPHDIVVVDTPVDAASKEEKLKRKQVKNIVEKYNSGNEKGKVNFEDLNNFDQAIYEIETFNDQPNDQKDVARVSKALDILSELSHDIKFGVTLTSDKAIFENLVDIATFKNDKISEKAYRIMGSSLRNNPEAINNVLKNSNALFVENLFKSLNYESDIVQKRILGIIHALTQNNHFNSQYFSSSNNQGIKSLISVFPSLGEESKQRFVNIFEDLNLLDSNNIEKRSEANSEPDFEISSYLQSTLSKDQFDSSSELKLYFEKLVDIHQLNKTLKPSKPFLEWLSQQVETRKENRKRDNYSVSDKEFDEFIINARHVVFGNPHGLRKALADEL
ncbi:hypothetical protein DFJ63DRAFT_334947 [Scheffersomyces coipomensis]|uniref:uncharacterized protein n=1 Tax=Scheffersomyces coipomensis TaxID=1788519 RepID=UPI00315D7F72